MILILFFILVLNIVAIALTYYSLSNLEKKEKIIFIAVGIAIIYVLTSLVYWISTKDIAIKEVSELGKNLITFLFVPINGLVVLPILAKSYNKYKLGSLGLDKLKNRGIVLIVILAIILMIECSYFKEIQNNVVLVIEKNNEKRLQSTQNNSNIIDNTEANISDSNQINNIANAIDSNQINDIETNEINDNQIDNRQTNQISNIDTTNTESKYN